MSSDAWWEPRETLRYFATQEAKDRKVWQLGGRPKVDHVSRKETLLNCFEEYVRANILSPTLRELVALTGYGQNKVIEYLKILVEEGKLTELKGKSIPRKYILYQPPMPYGVEEIKEIALQKGYSDILELIEDYYE